jgi:hypothetical protein
MYCTEVIWPTAKKTHVCTACGHLIDIGEIYARWVSFDGSAYTNKTHRECLDELRAMADYGDFEYTPGELAPPTRLQRTEGGGTP